MIETVNLLGILLGLGAALASACNNIFVRLGTVKQSAYSAYFVVITISSIVLVVAAGMMYYPNYGITPAAIVYFSLSGVVGTLIGVVLLYLSIKRIGAGRTTPIVASNALIGSILGVLFLGESATIVHAIGILLIVAGVAYIAWESGRSELAESRQSNYLLDITIPLLTAFAFGIDPIFANFGFAEGTPALVGVSIKAVTAWIGFMIFLWWRGENTILPSSGLEMRWLLFAGVAYTLFLFGYYVGLEVAPVNLILPLIILNTLFVVVIAAIFLPTRLERITWPLAAAAILVVIGAIFVTIY